MRKRQVDLPTIGAVARGHERVVAGSILQTQDRANIMQVGQMGTVCCRANKRRHRVYSELRWWLLRSKAFVCSNATASSMRCAVVCRALIDTAWLLLFGIAATGRRPGGIRYRVWKGMLLGDTGHPAPGATLGMLRRLRTPCRAGTASSALLAAVAWGTAIAFDLAFGAKSARRCIRAFLHG